MLQFHIQNFQAIRDVQFSVSGFTVMLGENDIGKSSTFRAIHGLFNNRSGDGFISLGQSKAQVSCAFDQNEITWVKEKKTGSRYTLSKNGVTSDFEKLGRSSPDFMVDFGFGAIHLKSGKSLDPHFSKQREEPFLLSRSGSRTVLTEFFSEVLKFGTLGKALSNVAKDLRDTNSTLVTLNKQEELQKSILTHFPETTALTNALDTAEFIFERISKSKETLLKIDSYLDLEKYNVVVPDFKVDVDEHYKLLIKSLKLRGLIERFLVVDKVSKVTVPEIDETPLKYLILLELELRLKDIVIPDVDETSFTQLKILNLSLEIMEAQDKLISIGTELLKLEAQFNSELQEMGVCPLCER